MISTKPPKEYLKAKDVKVQESDSKEGTIPAKEEPWGREVKSFKHNIDENKVHSAISFILLSKFISASVILTRAEFLSQDDDLDGEGDDDEEDDEEDPKSQQNTAPGYRRLIAIHAGKGKGGMQDWLRVDPDKVRRLSLSEPELEKAVPTYAIDIVRYFIYTLIYILGAIMFG